MISLGSEVGNMNINLVDPELVPFLERFPPLDIWSDLPGFRKKYAQRIEDLRVDLPVIEGVDSDDYTVDVDLLTGVNIRVYRPADCEEDLPAMLWLHGGGYCLGSIQIDDEFARNMVKNVGCVVVSVDYRLAPENRFPGALDDAYAVLKWIFLKANGLYIDAKRIAVGGISAGAGLAAGLALAARDRGEIELIFQSLWCPMLDDRNNYVSSYSINDPRVWSRDDNLRAWRAYLGKDGGGSDTSPYAAPCRAQKLSGLPPVYMRVGSLDLFLDEDTAYAQRLVAAGVQTDFAVIDGAFHAFEMLPGAELSRQVRDGHFAAIRDALVQ